jgi:hypothetical protein
MPDAEHQAAATIVDLALRQKPELIIQSGDLPATVEALREVLAGSERLFDRGVPVRIVRPTNSDQPAAIPLTKNNVVMEAHRYCQPIKVDRQGDHVPVTLPDRLAQMYLDLVGEWSLRPLSGISTGPLLSRDGEIRRSDGYDQATGLWCWRVPKLRLPIRPRRRDAELSLALIRQAFWTFPFADAATKRDPESGYDVVDTLSPPGQDESAFLVALLTACCRPSLWLAPGFLVSAPSISGAGSGKGLLVRATNMIAFGTKPRAFTPGHNRDELEKRLAAELVQAQPAVFLDNANGIALRSDTLASVLTERPASVRVLGETRMAQLNSTAFVSVTGNGLTLSEDLARRFIVCELDAHCEDPETRPFAPGFLNRIEARRAELLAAALTIWRWGRQNSSSLAAGRPLGSFEHWCEWCRDPLLELGCRDPVERIEAMKARDPKRMQTVEIFSAWWDNHGDQRLKSSDLSEAVRGIIDPQNRGRQFVQNAVASISGTQAGGFVLTRQTGAGRWSAATYMLNKLGGDHERHRGHRAHRGAETTVDGAAGGTIIDAGASTDPKTPMTPMPYEVKDEEDAEIMPGEEAKL